MKLWVIEYRISERRWEAHDEAMAFTDKSVAEEVRSERQKKYRNVEYRVRLYRRA
jgi:hypothetical protein